MVPSNSHRHGHPSPGHHWKGDGGGVAPVLARRPRRGGRGPAPKKRAPWPWEVRRCRTLQVEIQVEKTMEQKRFLKWW